MDYALLLRCDRQPLPCYAQLPSSLVGKIITAAIVANMMVFDLNSACLHRSPCPSMIGHMTVVAVAATEVYIHLHSLPQTNHIPLPFTINHILD